MNIIDIATPLGFIKASFKESNASKKRGCALMLGGLLADQLDTSSTSRAEIIQPYLLNNGIDLIRFNFTNHGMSLKTKSSGNFMDLSITRMIEDALSVVKFFNAEKLVMIGSSLGAGIMPDLAARIQSELNIETIGFFGISPLPPTALKAYVFSQMTDKQKVDFMNGSKITIASKTLPDPVEISIIQFEDIDRYGNNRAAVLTKKSKIKLLVGSSDSIATHAASAQLVNLLNGSNDDIKELNSPHSIDHHLMIPELMEWINELEELW